jgi:hypothetical protein
MRATISPCSACASSNVIELIAETAFHFQGLTGLKADPILVYPKATVCLDCGFNHSNLSEHELEQLRKASARIAAA